MTLLAALCGPCLCGALDCEKCRGSEARRYKASLCPKCGEPSMNYDTREEGRCEKCEPIESDEVVEGPAEPEPWTTICRDCGEDLSPESIADGYPYCGRCAAQEAPLWREDRRANDD